MYVSSFILGTILAFQLKLESLVEFKVLGALLESNVLGAL
jgi:hypothetical protein